MSASRQVSAALWIALALAFAFAAAPCAAQETIADYEKMALDKANAQDYDGALAILNEILKQYPTQVLSIYLDRAGVYERMMRFDAAVADYDTILKLDSTDPAKAMMVRPRIYGARAEARSLAEDFAGAVADYTVALSADPKLSKYNPNELGDLHRARGDAREEIGDLRGAIKDYDAAIAANPDNSFLFADRGNFKREARDYDGAIADYTASIAKADKPSQLTYEERGVAHICKGDFESALADFEQDAALGLVSDGEVYHFPIVHDTTLILWSLRARVQGKEKADAELSTYLASAQRHGDTDSEYDIANYFLGKAPESLVMDDAKALDGKSSGTAFHSVALYHIGMKRLIDGDKAGALANFNAVLKFQSSMVHMHELSRAEAGRLGPPKAAAKAPAKPKSK